MYIYIYIYIYIYTHPGVAVPRRHVRRGLAADGGAVAPRDEVVLRAFARTRTYTYTCMCIHVHALYIIVYYNIV